MDLLRNQFVEGLNQAATTGGEEALEARVRARLLETDGPPLSDEEASPLDLVISAYHRCPAEHRSNYEALFTDLLNEFSKAWDPGMPNQAQVTLASFALAFFERFPEVADRRRGVRVFVGGHLGLKEEISRLPPPENGAPRDLIGAVERLHLRLGRGEERFPASLELLWRGGGDAPRSVEEVAANGRLLIAMAETRPQMVDAERLYDFFSQTDKLRPPRGRTLLQTTFVRVGGALTDFGPEGVATACERLFAERLARYADADERGRIERFAESIGLVLASPAHHQRLKAVAGQRIKEAESAARERGKVGSVAKPPELYGAGVTPIDSARRAREAGGRS